MCDKMLPEKNQEIKILTVQEVADILRVHRSTVSRFAQSGELKSYQVGNRRLFKDKEECIKIGRGEKI